MSADSASNKQVQLHLLRLLPQPLRPLRRSKVVAWETRNFQLNHIKPPPIHGGAIELKAETGTCVQYGLKNKHELWKAQSVLRNLRNQSKNLQARVSVNDQQAKLEAELLLKKCAKLGLLPVEGSTLDDVLGLTENAMLDRRLQTMVLRKGLASTARQARQFIVHGHVSIDGRKVTNSWLHCK